MTSNPSILLQPSSETFSQSFSLYFLPTLGIVTSAGPGLYTGTRLIISADDEGWSDGDLLGDRLHGPGRDDIKHRGQAGHHSHQAGQG